MKHKTTPLLTIVIPTYNREDFLREALLSIQKQTLQDFEIILFDNASAYEITKFQQEFFDMEIKIIKHDENIGNQANFEFILSYQYQTPYVIIFHDDDTIHPNYFEDALGVLEQHPNVRWIDSLINYIKTPKNMSLFLQKKNKTPVSFHNKTEVADIFMSNLPLGFSPVIYRREVFANTKLNPTQFHKWCDRPFMLDACDNQKVAILHFPYVNYRLHRSQDSAQSYREHIPHMINFTEYLSSTGNKKTAKLFATDNAIRTAVQNSKNIVDFFTILKLFKDRKLFNVKHIRPYSVYWFFRLGFGRIKNNLYKN